MYRTFTGYRARPLMTSVTASPPMAFWTATCAASILISFSAQFAAQVAVQNAIGGEAVTEVINGRARYPVNVRYMRNLHCTTSMH